MKPICTSRPRGFTLIELLMTITVIGILAAMVLSGMSVATGHAKAVKTQATISKLHNQLMLRWESYRNRRLPVDPKALLLSGNAYVNNWITAIGNNLNQIQPGSGNALINVTSGNAAYPTPAQIAVVRLLALRELQRYEMPDKFGEIIDTSGTPGNWTLIPPNVLPTAPQLAQRYLAKVNAAGSYLMAQPGANAGQVAKQILNYDAAETLYLLLTNTTDESWSAGDNPKEVGDADGDGLLEFQDAWIDSSRDFPTTAPANMPITWIRWPAGYTNQYDPTNPNNPTYIRFVSNYQDDPIQLLGEVSGGSGNSVQPQLVVDPVDFSRDHHDYFDPLKLDLPMKNPTNGQIYPRGYQLTPLIFSAGPTNNNLTSTGQFNKYGLYQLVGVAGQDPNDPYATDSSQPFPGYNGQPIVGGGWDDNITNHLTRVR